MCIPFHIPVKPHVLKYLEATVGNPYKMNENDFVGIYLLSAMKRQRNEKQDGDNLQLYNERFTLNVSRHYVYNWNVQSVTSSTILTFNHYIDAIFRHNFICWMDVITQDTKSIDMKQAVETFKNKYLISEQDMSWDALYKFYYRHRKHKNNNLCLR